MKPTKILKLAPPQAMAVLLAVVLLALTGCSSINPALHTAADPVTITMSLQTVSLRISATQQFSATVGNATNRAVTWEVNGAVGGDTAHGTIDATGLYAAPATVPNPAVITVTAVAVADPTKTVSAQVTINAPPAISVSVSPTSAALSIGQTQAFTATLQNDSQNKGVNWTLSGTNCSGAACGALSAAGSASGTPITYTAPGTAPSGTVSLTATAVADGSKSAAASITISTPVVISVSVAPTTASFLAGTGTQAFTATLQNDTQNKGVTWTLSGAGCSGSACGTLSANASASGVAITYTPPATAPSPGTVMLTAKSVSDNSKTGSANITITAPAPAITVAIAPTTANVQSGGGTQPFTATVQNDGQNKGVQWTLSGAGCSGNTCGTLSANSSASGVAITYTAPGVAPSPATVTLTATSVADGTKSAAAVITVTTVQGNVTITISPKRAAVTTGQLQAFSATVTGSSNTGVTWSVDTITGGNATIGTIDASGNFTPPSTPGTHTITATSAADVTKSASAPIAVTDLAGVYTYHNDLSRDGSNAKEYALTTTTVATATFGKLFACALDAAAYAQPLWVANVSIGGGTHNVLIAATQHDTVYAFDADANPCKTYWGGPKSLLGSGETWVSSNDVNTGDLQPDIGIVGTPVIDPATNTIYVVAKSKTTGSGPTFHHRLHALSLLDGSEKFGGPVDIAFTSNGITFNPLRQNDRAGLALVNGVVYIAYASHGDNATYYGWLLGYNATSLAQVGVFNDDPGNGYGGIWMAGGAPAADASNNVYVITGNGNFDGVNNFGDSFLKFSTASGITLSSFFTPDDQSNLNGGDVDLGSGGAAILVDQATGPHAHLLIGGGKEGILYLLNRDSLGGYNSGNNNGAVQVFGVNNSIFSTPAFWQNTLFVAGVGGPLKSYNFNTGTGMFITAPSSQSGAHFGFPGATPSVSSTGSSNGIVWAIESAGAAKLHALDATNVGTELWNSGNVAGDKAGNYVKFTVPTVANGKVFIGTASEISVYGLKAN